jgi:hypothetical protein
MTFLMLRMRVQTCNTWCSAVAWNDGLMRALAGLIAQAERNETKMSLLNKDITQILDRRTQEGAGRSDVTPQELERARLTDAIHSTVKENAAKQQMWLQRQSELVRINKFSQTQQEQTEMVNSKVAVLSQKKYRVSRDIDTNETELKSLHRAFVHSLFWSAPLHGFDQQQEHGRYLQLSLVYSFCRIVVAGTRYDLEISWRYDVALVLFLVRTLGGM